MADDAAVQLEVETDVNSTIEVATAADVLSASAQLAVNTGSDVPMIVLPSGVLVPLSTLTVEALCVIVTSLNLNPNLCNLIRTYGINGRTLMDADLSSAKAFKDDIIIDGNHCNVPNSGFNGFFREVKTWMDTREVPADLLSVGPADTNDPLTVNSPLEPALSPVEEDVAINSPRTFANRLLSTCFAENIRARDPLEGLFAQVPREEQTSLLDSLERLKRANGVTDLLVKRIFRDAAICIQEARHDVDENRANINRLGLSVDELAVIKLYTMSTEPQETNFYYNANMCLRSRTRNQVWPFVPVIRYLTEALGKLPELPYSEPLTVYRGVKRDLTSVYKTGMARIVWPQFSSTTTRLTTLEDNKFLGSSGKRTLFHIKLLRHTQARQIHEISRVVNENEILLHPNVCFELDDVLPQGDLLIVRLQEVEFDHVSQITFGDVKTAMIDITQVR
jgi:hypothetical protein